jgi:pyrimidine-specific ribonucleoside hydrolase
MPVCLYACAEPSSSSLEPAAPHPIAANARPVLIDTDMAADDWLAILYLLGRSDTDVRAITVTGAGEAHCAPGVRNALDLVALAGRPEIPVACGRERPLQGDHTFPESWRERVDDLGGLTLPGNPRRPADASAVELLTRTIHGSSGKLHIVALGPLTNVAEALEAEPSLVEGLATITIMGGAVHVPGNVGPSSQIDNDVAEWNVYVDPHAAEVVLRSGVPTTLVPLDATNYAPLTMDFYGRLSKDRSTSVAEFVYRVLAQSVDWIRSGAYYHWDPLAAAIATDDSLGTFEALSLRVVEEEGPQSGRTVLSEDGHLIRVALTADRDRFETLFLDAVNGRLP